MINMAKLKQFFKGMQDHKYDSNTWMACVRGPNEIALSPIIQRLLSALPARRGMRHSPLAEGLSTLTIALITNKLSN